MGNHLYNRYPIGTSLVALPFVWLFDTVSSGAFGESLHHSWPIAQELIIACFIAALCAVVIFHIARLSLPLLAALFVTFIFAFCTAAWSTFSRALWQHGPSMLMLAASLYFFLRARERPNLVQYAGLFLALSYVIRPTNLISVVILTLYVFIAYRPYFVRYMLWAACIAVPFVGYNLSVFHSPVPAYYVAPDTSSVNQFGIAVFEHLIGPAQGLFIYSPIVLLSFVGIAIKVRAKTFNRLDLAIGIILILHWLMISVLAGWWAGSGFYGPRFFSDMLAYFMYFMIPAVAWLTERWRPRAVLVVATLVAISFYSNFYGATKQSSAVSYSHVLYPTPLWDWHYIEYLGQPSVDLSKHP